MELDSETRRGRDAVAENKKLLKQLADIRLQAEEDHRLVADLSDQVNNLQTRLVSTKRQLEESEEVLGITMNKYRKTQQQLEEAERRADRADKSVTTVRHTSLGPGGARSTRAVSVSRETTRVVRV
jgi:chromosome segregation ATPase